MLGNRDTLRLVILNDTDNGTYISFQLTFKKNFLPPFIAHLWIAALL